MYADCEVYIIIYLYTAKGVLKMTCLSNFSSCLCNIDAHHRLVFFPSSSLYFFFNVSTSGTCRLKKSEFFVRASAKGVKGAHCTCIPL